MLVLEWSMCVRKSCVTEVKLANRCECEPLCPRPLGYLFWAAARTRLSTWFLFSSLGISTADNFLRSGKKLKLH